MANSFGTDILIQSPDPKSASQFYVTQLGFEITETKPHMIILNGKPIDLFIERGPVLGPVSEVAVEDVAEVLSARISIMPVERGGSRPRSYPRRACRRLPELAPKWLHPYRDDASTGLDTLAGPT
jgi:hypothetical protein